MKKTSFILLGFLCFSFLLIGLEKPTIMLQININAKKVKAETLKSILRVGAEESFTKMDYRIINEENQRAALEEIKKQKKSDCLDDSCLIDTGGMLAAKEIIKIEVMEIAGKYLFTVKRMDIETGSGIKTISEFYEDDLKDMSKFLDFTKAVTGKILIKSSFQRLHSQKGHTIWRSSKGNQAEVAMHARDLESAWNDKPSDKDYAYIDEKNKKENKQTNEQKNQQIGEQKNEQEWNSKGVYIDDYCKDLSFDSCFNYALELDEKKKSIRIALYEELCLNRHAKSCNQLGYSYRYGVDVSQDRYAADVYYRKACGLNYKEGCYNYGDLNYYFFEYKEEARYGYRRACELGLKNDICSIIE